MALIKGQREYERFMAGARLTRKEAILAQCYICNGCKEGGDDCMGESNCPLYPFFPNRGNKKRS